MGECNVLNASDSHVYYMSKIFSLLRMMHAKDISRHPHPWGPMSLYTIRQSPNTQRSPYHHLYHSPTT